MSPSVAREAEPIVVFELSPAAPMLGTGTLTVVGSTSAGIGGGGGVSALADTGFSAGFSRAGFSGTAFPGARVEELAAGTLASTDSAFCSPVTWVLARRTSGLAGYSSISHRYRRCAVPRSSARPKRRYAASASAAPCHSALSA